MLSQNNHIFGYKPTVQSPRVGVRKSFLVGFQKAVSGFVMLMAGVVGVVIIIVAVKSSLGIVMHGEGWEVAHIALLLNMSTARQSNVNGWNDVAIAVHSMKRFFCAIDGKRLLSFLGTLVALPPTHVSE